MSADFVHLHVHSAFSLLDGCSRITDLVATAKDYDMPALALTDHGVMYGSIEFYKAARDAGIKPIIGCEVYVAPRSRQDRTPRVDDELAHLVLLATNQEGYRNLLNLVSRAYLEGFYYKPRVDKELLSQFSAGLIALSSCLAGEVPARLLEGDEEGARRVAGFYRDIFGRDNFYLELQDQNLPSQPELNAALVRLGQALDLPVVATNDVHYVRQQDATAHDILLCLQTGKSVQDPNRLRFPTQEFYLKSPQEMRHLFREVPQALKSTLQIADQCELEIPLGGLHLPEFPLPPGETPEGYLRRLCLEGLERRYTVPGKHERERLDYELSVIQRMGYTSYFLIVWDLVRFAHEKGILVGPGRGSAAGSLVAYTLGITDIDPLASGLLFERFLNPERVSMPDIDIDFADDRRDEVIEYVTQTYGADHVAQIITFGTMAARAAIRDAGRAYDLPYGDVDRIAKLVPTELGISLEHALQSSQELADLYQREEWVRQLIDTARSMEGLPRHASTHAAGVVISPRPLMEYVPLQKIAEGGVTTQYPWETIEEIGLLKMDFLGLRTLTVLGETVRLVQENRGEKVDLSRLPLDDAATYELLSSGATSGVFQLESPGMRALIKELKPSELSDLTALVALYRPGPLGSGMVEDFIARKHGAKPVEYLHPLLEPILNETYGVILYQEQVMQIASRLAGFTLGQADLLRRAMGKKKPEVIAAQRERFLAGTGAQGVPRDVAERVFELMEYFAGYGFNKSHSAAYGLLAYQTAYLKAHYPAEYMAALLTSIMDDSDKVALYAEDCRRQGLTVLPPDVNRSQINFSVENGRIRFGLAAVKNAGRSAMAAIVAAREEGGPFRSLQDFCRRVDLRSINKRTLESLIKAGALSSLPGNRAQHLAVMDAVVREAQAYQSQRASGQGTLLDLMPDNAREAPLPELLEVQKAELLAWEKEALGFYLTGHPLADKVELLRQVSTVQSNELTELEDAARVVMGGLVTGLKRIRTNKGETMAFVTLEDLTGSLEVVVFPRTYAQSKSILQPDALIVVRGRVSKREEEAPKILADEALPLDGTRELYLRLTEDAMDLCRIEDELKVFPGLSPVFLFYPAERRLVRLGPQLSVSLQEGLIERLKALLGEENVAVKVKNLAV
ncbi:MAG: DNA polymerase III subunit alpha [Firmicutes bacterium]|nr:DNA polymerase III subunit alpha [Bacillota bacterium]